MTLRDVLPVALWTISAILLYVAYYQLVIAPAVLDTSAENREAVALHRDETDPAIVFVGDLLLARDVERHMQRYGASYPFAQIAEYLQADVVVANFEAAIPKTHIPTPDFNTRFSVASSYMSALAEAGITHVSLANNHSFDFGSDEYAHTSDVLQKNTIGTFGTPYAVAPHSHTNVQFGDIRVALIGINAVGHAPQVDELATLLNTVSQETKYQFVYIHWGEEYDLRHSRAQARLAHALVEAGADLIVGHHPHVVQDVEVYKGVPIFYSLGNFVFDQYFSDEVQEGLLLTVRESDIGMRISLLPMTSKGHRAQPAPMSQEEKVAFLQELAARSNESLREYILAGAISVGDLQFDHDSSSMSRLVQAAE